MTLPKYMSKDAKPALRPNAPPTNEEIFAKLLKGEVVFTPFVRLENETAIDSIESGGIDSFDM